MMSIISLTAATDADTRCEWALICHVIQTTNPWERFKAVCNVPIDFAKIIITKFVTNGKRIRESFSSRFSAEDLIVNSVSFLVQQNILFKDSPNFPLLNF